MSDRETVLAGVREALAGVANPRTGEDVLAGGQVQGLSLDEDGKVHFQFLLKAEDPGTLVRAARAAAESVAGVSKVKIEVKLPKETQVPGQQPQSRRPAPHSAPRPWRACTASMCGVGARTASIFGLSAILKRTSCRTLARNSRRR